MHRRELLKMTALASVGGSGCASLLHNPGAVSANELGGFLTTLDGAMASIGSTPMFDRFLPQVRSAQLQARAKAGEELTRKTLRSLLLVGTTQELPPEHLAHEGVQQRLRESMGEFDDSMFGMTAMLEGLSPSDRAGVSKSLRDDPQLGMRIMGALDEEAAGFGVSFKLRTKLRGLSVQACSRLRQSPDLAITEYAGKMHKVVARHGARAEVLRQSSAALGASLLFQGEADEGRGSDTALGGTTPAEQKACTEDSECSPGLFCGNYREVTPGHWTRGVCLAPTPKQKKPKAAAGVLTAGGLMMGLAVTGFAIGFAKGGVMLGATVGAILGVIGVVILIVGLIMLAVESSG